VPSALMRLQAIGMHTLEPERLEEPTSHHQRKNRRRRKGSSPEALKRFATSVSRGRWPRMGAFFAAHLAFYKVIFPVVPGFQPQSAVRP
jgi:hypothetical protein